MTRFNFIYKININNQDAFKFICAITHFNPNVKLDCINEQVFCDNNPATFNDLFDYLDSTLGSHITISGHCYDGESMEGVLPTVPEVFNQESISRLIKQLSSEERNNINDSLINLVVHYLEYNSKLGIERAMAPPNLPPLSKSLAFLFLNLLDKKTILNGVYHSAANHMILIQVDNSFFSLNYGQNTFLNQLDPLALDIEKGFKCNHVNFVMPKRYSFLTELQFLFNEWKTQQYGYGKEKASNEKIINTPPTPVIPAEKAGFEHNLTKNLNYSVSSSRLYTKNDQSNFQTSEEKFQTSLKR